MEDNYPKAYKETYEIIKYLPKEEYEMIPKDVIKMLGNFMDKEYEYKVDKSKPFEQQIMLKETKELLAIFYRDYWASAEEVKKINQKIRYDINEAEKVKKEKYNSEKLFNQIEMKEKNIEELSVSKEIIKIENEKWYSKIFNLFKRIFKRKG